MSETKITVRIDSSRPLFIEADAESFGAIFAGLNDDEQVNVLRSMVKHMKPHQAQWDYIAIALEKEENRQVRDDLSVIFPSHASLVEENRHLREERDQANSAWSVCNNARNASRLRAEKAEAERDAAREFVKRHPSLSLIDLAEFEAFLKAPAMIDAALSKAGA